MANEIVVNGGATLPAPFVNLNGSSVGDLIDQVHEAVTKVEAAHKAVCAAFPHGRDYQINPAGEYDVARAMFENYNRALVAIHADLTDCLENLCEQRDTRDRQFGR